MRSDVINNCDTDCQAENTGARAMSSQLSDIVFVLTNKTINQPQNLYLMSLPSVQSMTLLCVSFKFTVHKYVHPSVMIICMVICC